jgi:tetratricopeptide (TPR) repeat protein
MNVMFRAVLILFLTAGIAPIAAGQQASPEDILKDAIGAHQSGDFERAIEGYRKVLAIHDSPDIRSNLGAALASTGRYDDAIIEYKKALKSGPRNPRIWVNLALAYYKAGQIATAAGELAALHREQPDNRQVTLLLADCRLRMGENAKVIELLEPVAAADTADLAAAYMLGSALLRSKQVDRGQQMIDRILRNGDSAEAHLLLGTAKLNALEYNDAIAELEKAVALNPKLPDGYAYLGRAQMDSGNMTAARTAFEKELEQNPNNFEANLKLAVLLKESQDYDAARKLLDRALRVRPGDLAVLFQVASIGLATGELDKARVNLENIVKKSPDFVEAHVSLATIYYRQKRKEAGDREREIVRKLNAEKQAREAAAGAKP